MEYEPDKHGRFTVMKGPRKTRETLRIRHEDVPSPVRSTTQNKKY